MSVRLTGSLTGSLDAEVVESLELYGALEISVELLSDTTLVWCRGEIDMATEAEFRAALTAQLGGGVELLVLDLLDVGFVSCAGMRLLEELASRACVQGVALRVLAGPALARRIVGITSADPLSPVDRYDAELPSQRGASRAAQRACGSIPAQVTRRVG